MESKSIERLKINVLDSTKSFQQIINENRLDICDKILESIDFSIKENLDQVLMAEIIIDGVSYGVMTKKDTWLSNLDKCIKYYEYYEMYEMCDKCVKLKCSAESHLNSV